MEHDKIECSPMIVEGWSRGEWKPHHNETWPAEFGEVKEDTTFSIWDHKTRESTEKIIPAGTTVRIVMVSRFGDVGITHDLETEVGYHARIFPEGLDNLRKEL